jgi:hypothetical protein
VGGKRYQVESATNLLETPAFVPLATVTDTNAAGIGAVETCIDTNAFDSILPRFYRVRLAP